MILSLHTIRLIIPILLLFLTTTTGFANDENCDLLFASKTVKLIVPNNVGGDYDTFARIFARHFELVIGSNVLVENLPGGKGLVGARKLMNVDPDELTIGVMDASKRIVDKLIGEDETLPDILNDFTLLARYDRSRHVLVVGKNSNISDLNGLLNPASPPVLGTKNLRSNGFLSTVLVSDLMNFDFDTVTGLGGIKKRVLAVTRGDVDFISSNFSSIVADIESGTVRPILQVSSSRISEHPSLDNVPILGGGNQSSIIKIEGVSDISQRVKNIEALTAVGRLLVAPDNLSPDIETCLKERVMLTLYSEELKNDLMRVNHELSIEQGSKVRESIEKSLPELQILMPIIEKKLNSFD